MKVQNWSLKWFAPALLAVILTLIAFISPAFFSRSNLMNVLRQVAVPGIVASGMAVVIIAGGFDLSVGAVTALAGVLAVNLAPHGLWMAAIVPVLAGALLGAVNGWLICRAAIHPLIVTLGMRYLIYAAATLYTHGFIQVNRQAGFLFLGRASLLGLPVPMLFFLTTLVLLQFLLRTTVAGSATYAIGNNDRAAFYSGVRTGFFRVLTYLTCGACAALAGVVVAARSGAAAPDAGQGYELEAIAAVALGGISLLGGAGSLWNSLGGVLVFGLLNNLLVLLRQPYEMHRIVAGAMIVASLGMDVSFWRKSWRR